MGKGFKALYKFLPSLFIENASKVDMAIKRNYELKLEELKQRPDSQKIRVAFLIRENQKWCYQSLYELLENDDRFEPFVIITLLELAHRGKDKTRNNLEENYNFFAKKGIRVEVAYKDKQFLDLRIFSPDLVFYDQPWDLPEIYMPEKVSEFALTFYVAYGYGLLNTPSDYTECFHRRLFRYYVDNDINIERFESYRSRNSENCVSFGYPKLDTYLDKEIPPTDCWREDDKVKIIYAPHHSLDKRGLRFATFKENGKFILELAKKYQDKTVWVFKPHPRLKYALLRNKIMNLDEINAYYEEWNKIGNIYTQGDYFDIFKTSDLMITDCCSFMAEYLPANKPLIHPKNPKGVSFNKIGSLIKECCYETTNNNEIEAVLKELVINKNDYKKELREKNIPLIIDFKEKSSLKIYKDIISILLKGV